MTTKAERHKPSTRPKKKPAEKARRLGVQKRRLIALGVSEATVEKLDAKKIRTLLRKPKDLKRTMARLGIE
jgi:hypothetical protein